MQRSKEAWLTGPADLREEIVEDVPVPGASVLVRGLSAKYSSEVLNQLKFVQEGSAQTMKVDVPRMELLQFVYGVIDPQFTEQEAAVIQERMGPAFKKVVAKIDELSGFDKEAVEKTEQRFQGGGDDAHGPGSNGTAGGDDRPDLDARTGVGVAHAGGGDVLSDVG